MLIIKPHLRVDSIVNTNNTGSPRLPYGIINSFQVVNLDTINIVKISGGVLTLANYEEFATYDGVNLEVDLDINLNTEVNSSGVVSPTAYTSYFLYLKIDSAGSPQVSSLGRNVYPCSKGATGAFIVLQTDPKDINLANFVPLALLRTDGLSNYNLYQNLSLSMPGAALTSESSACPVGSIMQFTAVDAPSGWFICDGADVSRTIYSDLFSVIGTTFGVGDGVTTFNLPDLRGEFVRGWDIDRGIDATRTLGSPQLGQLGQHNHTFGTLAVGTANAPHAHPGSTANTANAPHAHPGSTADTATAPHAHPGSTAATGAANAPHSHTITRALSSTATGPGTAAVLVNLFPTPSTAQETFNQTAAAPHAHPASVTVATANAPHSHTLTISTATAPHSHTLTISTDNAPHSHSISGSVAPFGGISNPVSPIPTPAPTAEGEIRPRNIALNFIIKY